MGRQGCTSEVVVAPVLCFCFMRRSDVAGGYLFSSLLIMDLYLLISPVMGDYGLVPFISWLLGLITTIKYRLLAKLLRYDMLLWELMLVSI